jgi:hypothetical protein
MFISKQMKAPRPASGRQPFSSRVFSRRESHGFRRGAGRGVGHSVSHGLGLSVGRGVGRGVSHTLGTAVLAASCCFAATASADLLLTEIHYNGPASGTDPDEFLELSNAGTTALQLGGYSFSAGIGFSFPSATQLDAGESLVVARSSTDFMQVYAGFSAPLFDFSGALSNSGETLTLIDALGAEVWSLDYDDNPPWPSTADGGGDSLQLALDALNLTDAANWRAARPTPGQWRPSEVSPAAVPAPAPLQLMLTGIGLLGACAARAARRGAADKQRCQEL